MSHNKLVHEVGEKAVPWPSSGNGECATEVELPSEKTDALLGRARDILAGRIQPPALVVPPEVEQFLQREFRECEPQPTAEALRRITERLCLEAHYGGQPVACFTTLAGTLAVLASGDVEVEALLRGLSVEEASKVVVNDTVPWLPNL